MYLDTVGHVVIAWMWLKQALAVSRTLEQATGSEVDIYIGKQAACRFFYRRELPKVALQMKILEQFDGVALSMSAEEF